MRKIFLLILSFALWLSAPLAYAQGKADVAILGKKKGTVSSIKVNNQTLLDGRATAKKLGGSVEVFSTAKQIKIAFPGMYAILSASLDEAIINASSVKLPTEVVASGGKIYVPVQFFMLPIVQKALNRKIAFEDNTLVVEKNYNLAFSTKEQKQDFSRLILSQKGNIPFQTQEVNKHTVKVTFPQAVLKRDINQRLKDNFIRSFSLTQKNKGAELKIILGKKAQKWSFQQEKGQLVFVVFSGETISSPKNIPVIKAAQDAQELSLTTSDELVPSIFADEAASTKQAPVAVIQPATPTTVLKPADPVLKPARRMRIMIDPGHGGKDPGAVRRGSTKEKDLNLSVAKHLYEFLKRQGFEVKLTRDKDAFVALAGRSKQSNDYKADLFVSIHTNAAKRTAANGFEVYFRSDKATDKEAAEVAAFENEALQYEETHYNFVDMLLQSLAKNEYMNESSKVAGHVRNYVYKEPGIGIAVRQANSIRQANFYVLKGVQSPAILVEMGYLSSPKDRGRLNNKTVQKRMAQGIGKGIVSYAKAEGWLDE